MGIIGKGGTSTAMTYAPTTEHLSFILNFYKIELMIITLQSGNKD